MGPDVILMPSMMQAISVASSYVQSFTEAIFSHTGSALQVSSIKEKGREVTNGPNPSEDST